MRTQWYQLQLSILCLVKVMAWLFQECLRIFFFQEITKFCVWGHLNNYNTHKIIPNAALKLTFGLFCAHFYLNRVSISEFVSGISRMHNFQIVKFSEIVKRYYFFRIVSFRFSNFPFRSVSFHDLVNLFLFRFWIFFVPFRFVSEKNNVSILRFRKNNVSSFRFAWIFLFHGLFCTSKAGLDFNSGPSIFYNFIRYFWAVTGEFLVSFLVTWRSFVLVKFFVI
jgi:hypothetical protein